MNKSNKELDDIINNLYKMRFINELNYYKQEQVNIDDKNFKINDLSRIIQAIDEEYKKPKTDIYTDLEKYEYKKKWFRIKTIYKIKKIKEYVEEKYSKNVQGEIYDILINLLNNTKKLNTKLAVEYDMDKEKIISMPIMKKEKDLKKFILKKID